MKEHLALTNLRDKEFFPSFMECPHESEVPYPNSDYYEPEEGFYVPISHRCFLGEITECVASTRSCLTVKDRADNVVTVNFYLDSHNFGRASKSLTPGPPNFSIYRNVPKSLTKKGNTIAILYAMRHDFEDGSIGFRIDNANEVQLFPCTLERFLALGDRILTSNSRPDSVRACHRCNTTASQRCSGCHVTWYCGKDCQAGDWSDGGHKKDCKLLNQVATLMKQDWKHSPKEFRFPLPKG